VLLAVEDANVERKHQQDESCETDSEYG
jgi:hypothetical protein